jgi:hypothetical protein
LLPFFVTASATQQPQQMTDIWRDSKAVMQRIANPSSPVRLWVAPPDFRSEIKKIAPSGAIFICACRVAWTCSVTDNVGCFVRKWSLCRILLQTLRPQTWPCPWRPSRMRCCTPVRLGKSHLQPLLPTCCRNLRRHTRCRPWSRSVWGGRVRHPLATGSRAVHRVTASSRTRLYPLRAFGPVLRARVTGRYTCTAWKRRLRCAWLVM